MYLLQSAFGSSTLTNSYLILMMRPEATPTIGILGAGVTDLYTAFIIDSLDPESGITYRILEADERVGGRLYTHKFEGHTQMFIMSVHLPNIPQSL